MTKRISFTKNLNRLLPRFRDNMSNAESTEDVKKFFYYAVRELLEEVFEDIKIDEDDVILEPNNAPYFVLSQRLLTRIDKVWKESDLPHLIEKLAESAIGRFRHLQKHPEKTESKIRM